MDRAIDERLAAAGLTLPNAPEPLGVYRRGILRGTIGCLSGQLPVRDGRPIATGLVGRDLSAAEGRALARDAALNVLAQLKALLGSFDRLDGLLRVDGFVASAPGWTDQATVLDGASELFRTILGERGAHARSAVGVPALPLDAPVELVVTFAVRPPAGRGLHS
jgi:enamine deaminase RidA (YjgF/YER057c/UK114 family)